jgi:nucleotide-binding universal stress UspA family protein
MIQLKKILFPTDFSDLSRHALKYALSFAKAYEAELHVMHVVDEAYQYWMAMGPSSLPVGPLPDELLDLSKRELTRFVEEHLSEAGVSVVSEAIVGRPFVEIISYAKDRNVDLIVLGTHGRSGLRHVLLGSVAERVVRKAPCPVLTIRHPEHDFVMP